MRQPDQEKAKRKLKNYKLKFSRLLTCYSALLFLLASHVENGTVSTDDARQMVALTPTERLEWLLSKNVFSRAHEGASKLLSSYEKFLTNTARPEKDLIENFLDREAGHSYFAEAALFGEQMFKVLESVGQGQSFYRMLIV